MQHFLSVYKLNFIFLTELFTVSLFI